MSKYRKRPVVVEAFQYDGDFIDRNGVPYVPQWAMDALKQGVLYYGEFKGAPGELFAKTLEGDHHVSYLDYVVRGIKDELYPCKPDIFEATYEEVPHD